MESITFNTAENKIIVELKDGSTKEYTTRESYVAVYPEREEDATAMGW